jgi:hypothetical protein
VEADKTQAVGDCVASGSASISPACDEGAEEMDDPLEGVYEKPCSGASFSPCTDNSSTVLEYTNAGDFVIEPGVYNGIKVSGDANLWFKPGVYVLRGKGFQAAGNGTVKICRGTGDPEPDACDGVTNPGILLFNTTENYPTCSGNAEPILLNGNGAMDVAAQTTGDYAHLLIWQDECTPDKDMQITGNGGLSSTTGTIYLPDDHVQVCGNGGLTTTSAFYAENFKICGNGGLTVNYDPDLNVVPTHTVSFASLVE